MERYGFGILFQDLNNIMNVGSFVITSLWRVIELFLDVVGRLIEAIPVIE